MTDEKKGTLTVNVALLGFLMTFIVQIVALTFFLAKLESGLAETSSRADSQARQIAEHLADVRSIERQVQYLCNERRRDNQEAGRTVPQVC